MKKSTPLLLIILMLTASFMVNANSVNEAVKRSTAREDHRYVLKIERKNVGASLEVVSSTGERIVLQKVRKRKVVIYFEHVRLGEYTIRIRKGNDLSEYRYIKK